MNREIKKVRYRMVLVGGLFLMMFFVVGIRAFQLQFLKGENYKRLGEKQHQKKIIIQPRRGSIFGSSGEKLAISLGSRSVASRPRRIKNLDDVVAKLAPALSMSKSDLRRKLKTKRPFVWIKRQITPKETTRVLELGFEGVELHDEPNRIYPNGSIAGQVIGFVGRDSKGLEGLERDYDSFLDAKIGSSVIERDALGRKVLVRGLEDVDVPKGGDVHLTLGTPIQHLVEKNLRAAVIKFQAKSGVAVMVEPFTGEILALANYPFFDPNNFSRQSSRLWRNRAIADLYEPGSTFKAILAAAALEERAVGMEDNFYCEQGKYLFGGKTIHDSKKHGWLPFYKIIQYSSNIGTTKVAEKLKKRRFFKYIKNFGFGVQTKIDLPGEGKGLVRLPARWSRIDLATHSFGQGIAVTPIQMAMAYAAIANGGELMRPFVVRRITGSNGEVLFKNSSRVVRRVISTQTARTLNRILRGVVREGGTGVMARMDGFEVAGKTGTSQKADLVNGGYSKKKRLASFIGFVPARDPRLVILIIIDEPSVNVYGGVVAAPVFRDIARGTLRHLGVVPEISGIPWVPKVEKNPSPQVEGEEKERGGELVKNSGAPNFIGLSLRKSILRAKEMDLHVVTSGSGYVVKQFPVSGSEFLSGGTLSLTFGG